MKDSDKFSFYKEHPKNCAPNDFWGQVKRTVNGRAVTEDQIQLIVDAVQSGLKIDSNDTLLDLCCGNGALSIKFFDRCKGGVGVDFSEILIDIAKRNFGRPPTFQFILSDICDYALQASAPLIFSKALCYGSFQFLTASSAETLLTLLSKRFRKIRRFFIGNLPDKNKLSEFYRKSEYTLGIENDPTSPIGIWRTTNEFDALAKKTGWKAQFRKMPADYYAAHYRYDAILTPLGGRSRYNV